MIGNRATGLDRFVAAQDGVWDDVVAELTAGRKRSHWMWFVFPQLKGLGRSGTALFYGLDGRDEAEAYWRHATLQDRLVEATRLVVAQAGATAQAIFGSPDDLKLKSCMTLFAAVAPDEPSFARVLDDFYGGQRDEATQTMLASR